MINVAMLSKWHVHAVDYAKAVMESDFAKITVVWDEDVQRGEAWAKELGAEFEADLDTLLARADVDAVICDTPTTKHTEVLTKVAKAGKHIFTEKALATTVADCKKIMAEIEKAGITFTISYPLLVQPTLLLAKQMIDNGDFGKISFARFRRAHNGVVGGWLPDYWFEEKDAGGGALMDLGCHGFYVANYLFGKPKRISNLLTNLFGTPVDESATTSIEFENGTVFNAETGFITHGYPDVLEVHGEKAILVTHGQKATIYNADGESTPTLPEKLPQPIDIFLEACAKGTGTPKNFGLDAALALTHLLEEAYKSNSSNTIIPL